jgi:hypothetical protein
MRIVLGISVFVAALCGINKSTLAGCPHCDNCGCQSHVRRICVAVCDAEVVKKVKWGCQCTEICIPGPTRAGCHQPACGHVRIVKQLVKKEVTEELPVCKWVVTHVCESCGRLSKQGFPKDEKADVLQAPGKQPVLP